MRFRKNRLWILGLIAAAIIAAGLVASRRAKESGEPSYQGKTITVWLQEASRSADDRELTMRAVREMGTNALPFLLREIAQTESPTTSRASATVRGVSALQFTTAADRTRAALLGFEALGPVASPAIPALIEMFRDADTSYGGHDPAFQAGKALIRIGAESFPALIAATTHTNEMIRVHACFTLGYSGKDPGVEALIGRLKDTSRLVRIRAAIALGYLHARPAVAIPALMASLEDEDSAVRHAAAEALAEFGADAEVAVPALRNALAREAKTADRKAGNGSVLEAKTISEVQSAIQSAARKISPSIEPR